MREPLFLRLYRRTLAPASDEFRGRYAREMEQSLVSMMAAERARRGRLAAAWLWLRAVADARRIAWRERPPGRSVRARRVLAGLGDDVSYVWRSWRRAPGFAATAVLTLSLGIALNASIFSLADGLLFRPLPFPDPDHLFQVRSAGARRGFPWAIDMREARARHPD